MSTRACISCIQAARTAQHARLHPQDVEYLRDRDSDNQAVFETWTKRKQLEAELEKDEAAK